MGKETHTHTDTVELAIVPDTIVRWGPRSSAHINRDKPAPSKHTYNLLEWKAELLRVKRGRGGRVPVCNYLRGQPADPRGPESWTRCVWRRRFMVCFRVTLKQEWAAELYLWAPVVWFISPHDKNVIMSPKTLQHVRLWAHFCVCFHF